MKNGFTLVELLAIVLILAIIALIAIPSVNKIVDKAKINAFKETNQSLVDVVSDECSKQLLKSSSLVQTYNLSNRELDYDLDIKGKLPIDGSVMVDNNCNVKLNTNDNKYCAIKLYSDDKISVGYYTASTGCSIGSDTVGTIKDRIKEELYDDDICRTDETTYEYMGGCYLKGKQYSNFLWWSGNLYRIMGIDENDNVRLISEASITATPYNYHNNLTPTPNNGNVFSESYVKGWLDNYFVSHLSNPDMLKNTSYCADTTDDIQSSRTTCTNIVSNSKVALISLDEYRLAAKPKTYACNDIGYALYQHYHNSYFEFQDYLNSLSSSGKTCMQYVKQQVDSYAYVGMTATYNEDNITVDFPISYLDNSYFDSFYTLTGSSSDSAIIWYGHNYSHIFSAYSTVLSGIRPVITLPSDLDIVEGDGGRYSPYMIENEQKSGKLNNKAVSGEYVELGDKNYRVVEVTELGTKLVLDGYLSNDSFENMSSKMANNTYLDDLGLSSLDNRLVNYTWDYGPGFTYGDNYTVALTPTTNTFTSKVGGLRIGEMYSSQSNSIQYLSKRPYWTITKNKESANKSVWTIEIAGDADWNFIVDYSGLNTKNGIRPAIVISTDTTISSGNGTLDDPYELSDL